MNKKILISIISFIIIICLFFLIWKIVPKDQEKSENLVDNIVEENQINISETVTDECIDEWEDYNSYIEQEIEETSNEIAEENTHYLIKDVEGYIYVYYLDDNNEEILYKETEIATDYLSPEDIDDLEIGIEVVGIEALNKMLEDFE